MCTVRLSAMGARKIKQHSISSEGIPSPPPHSFRTLISAIQSPEDLKPPLMKAIYYILLHLSLKEPLRLQSNSLSPKDYYHSLLDMEVDFRDVQKLSEILFKELDGRFKRFFSDLHDVKSDTVMSADALEELALLLRCCMVILNLLDFDQDLLLEKGRVLLLVLKVLISLKSGENESNGRSTSVRVEKIVSRQCAFDDGDTGCTTSVAEDFAASLCFLEPSDPCRPFLCALLEVMADELLINRSLREYLMLVDSASCKNEALFTSHFSHGNIGSVLEVVSAHFLLSVFDEQAFDIFINRLIWQHDKDFRFPELSLTPVVSLLLNPIMLSAPKMFLAHFISLVSETIGFGMSPRNLRPDPRLMDCYLTVFERSLILYSRHMSSLQIDDHPVGSKGTANPCMLGRSQLNFDSYIQQDTKNKIDRAVLKSDDFWDSYLCNRIFGTKSDLVAGSILYMKECHHVFDESCRDEILSILDCIILRAFPDDVHDNVLYKKGETSPQDIYLLASILKLMSCSLAQAIWCLRHGGNLGCLKTLQNASSCKEYDFMVGLIRSFQQFNVHLPVQRFLSELMENLPRRHKESKWMLLHFSGLLSLSFNSGINFLVKGCISIMMSLMNLFAFEEGDLGSLRSLLGIGSEAFPPKSSFDEVHEPLVDKKTSKKVASRFQKVQTLYLSVDSLRSFHQITQNDQVESSQNVSTLNHVKESTDGIEEETVETCNGEIFLNCILEGSGKSSEYNDVADFIECKQGKDYCGWLKDRQKYRKWKCQKMAVLRWKKKKKTWKSMKGREL
ncbi:hypothetical protein I3843_03G016700 [Carya illinoinensis]|uniref:DUF7812 domain-containing protein n=1 Tax=Carya illinoinensis TaxID=32201 RepID=A0A8T1QYL0_CARIL|nr:uncharacterized protein LOC122302404 [Carya illinoinensis]KAG6659244.1 hypothetical protein CIPAW_03G020000 [Carya illinoinensis]KAG7985270.1 hypothetical protein I3843_03G016700 [Carya illinoinensis]